MDSSKQTVPQNGVGNWPRIGRVVLSVLIGSSILSLALAVGVMQKKTRELESAGRFARLEAQNEAMVAELSAVRQELSELSLTFMDSRVVASRARDLVGLNPELTVIDLPDHTDGSSTDWDNLYAVALSRTGIGVDQSLKTARELRVAFEEIVIRMEWESEVWACIPTTRPLEVSRLTSSYGRRRDPFTGRMAWHRGLDLSAPRGTPVLASAEGRVIRSGYYGAYGRLVEMDHGNGLRTRYAHNSRNAVKVGQWVSRGDVVAYVGSSGRASAPHLHYEVRLDGEPVNPEPYLWPETMVAD